MAQHQQLQAIAVAIAACAESEDLARAWLEQHGAAIPEGEARWYDIGPSGQQMTVLGGWGPLSENPTSFFIPTTRGA